MPKTPLTLVNELCLRNDLVAHYKLLSTEYNGHHTYDVVISGEKLSFHATGKARTKKGAKHRAAYEALKKIVDEENALAKEDIDLDKVRSPHVYETDENYVKKLKCLCLRNMLPVPVYLTTDIEELESCKNFTVQCRISSLAESSKSHSKKYAKQCASYMMIKKLLDIRKLNLIVEHDESNEVNETLKTIEKNNIESIENDTYFYSKINISDYYQISMLEESFFPLSYAVSKNLVEKTVDDLDDPKSCLSEICKISDVGYAFFRLDRHQHPCDDTNISKIIVVLKLNTYPQWMSFGKGVDEEEAQRLASRKMLAFLKALVLDVESIQE